MPFVYQTDAERRAIEAAIAFVAEMHQLALAAPHGQVLGLCEQQALGPGRDLLRSTLQQAVQARVAAAEQKGARPAPARVAAGSASSAAAGGKC